MKMAFTLNVFLFACLVQATSVLGRSEPAPAHKPGPHEPIFEPLVQHAHFGRLDRVKRHLEDAKDEFTKALILSNDFVPALEALGVMNYGVNNTDAKN